MKKFILAIVSVAFLASAGTFVNAKDNPREDMKKSIEEMNTLVEKYNKASDKKKPGIEKQIKEKVSANYDRHLKQMEERTAKLEERVTKMKEELEKMKTDEAKTKHVDEITKKIILMNMAFFLIMLIVIILANLKMESPKEKENY